MGLMEFLQREIQIKNLREQLKKINRKLEEMKARAERAEEMWTLQYHLSTSAAHDLQNEKLNSAQTEAKCLQKFMRDPRSIIAAFCGLLDIGKEEFFANLNLGWAEKINRALAEKNCCEKGKCGTSECQEKDCKTK